MTLSAICVSCRDETAKAIRRRYTGDVAAFARRRCPFNAATWERNVRHFMRRQGVTK